MVNDDDAVYMLARNDGEPFMSDQFLELLKSLAIRPSRTIAPNLEPIATALLNEGYVSCGPDGWIATAKGCNLIQRSPARFAQQGSILPPA